MILAIVLILLGFMETGTPGPKTAQSLTTVNPDKVMWLYLSGAISFFVGLGFFIKR